MGNSAENGNCRLTFFSFLKYPPQQLGKYYFPILPNFPFQFLRTDMESLKYALRNQRWLTTERVFTVLDVILQMTKMNGSIAVAHDAMKILGLENKVFDWSVEFIFSFIRQLNSFSFNDSRIGYFFNSTTFA